ncbi:Rrf2 family transcriptional regulator [Methylocapsa sp. D3K7]|uniref:RrF2 family transcriptional regulator n=1 Tax=Methylocapsa sp. D3K7 TaxID=3041435 RepID=UPI00244E7A6F|nr:Rrf2 family transcriptional regulator [Methylocapsa sp. D3K7]WGJ13535.1 Rrf2 family transcriptional regulator [Methylocapsa sp. D3K7]
MILLSRRGQLALAAVVDIAIHARPLPVAAKALAARLELPPRRLESLLQELVHANILKGVRGPRGGYELARERRRITAASILRAVSSETGGESGEAPHCQLVKQVVAPIVEAAGQVFLDKLETITIDDICRRTEDLKLWDEKTAGADFAI